MKNRWEDQIISFKPLPLEEDPRKMAILKTKAEQSRKRCPGLTDFKDIYSTEEIEKDERLISEYKRRWNEERDEKEKFIRDFSEIYEVAVIDLLATNKTFGEENRVVFTNEFDNIFNAIDGAVIIEQEGKESEYLGLNMDVTYSSKNETLEDKMESIKQCIRKGVLPTLKYFQDPKTKEHKKIFLPKIIIGSQQSAADGLIRLWGETNSNNREKLKNHPIQSKIIMEALSQLSYFYNFAKNLSEKTREDDMREKYTDIYNKYGQMYNYFLDIYYSKKDLIESHYHEIINDAVYKEIVKMTT